MEEYEITMSNGEVIYILAPDLEQACWDAFELSKGKNTKLKDVVQTYVCLLYTTQSPRDVEESRMPCYA